jgi:glycosyltransferase involved in cell wall biosynthesis
MKLLAPLSQEQIISTWGNKTQPLVSVTIITYNHELYIEQAIMGVMAQVTNFPFEVIIHDDASTDNTQAIIKKYVQKYPQIIIPILQTENHWLGKGINATTTIVWPSAKGKYIAWLEGDDYWTDPYKLQKQVDFLEANPSFSICSHRVTIMNEMDNNNSIYPTNIGTSEYDFSDFIDANKVATCSLFFKSEYLYDIPKWFSKFEFGDWGLILYVLAQSKGKMKLIEDTMGVYRIHHGGIYGGKKHSVDGLINNYQKHIRFFKLANKYIIREFNKSLLNKSKSKQLWYYDILFRLLLENNKHGQFLKLLIAFSYDTCQFRKTIEYAFIYIKQVSKLRKIQY